MTSSFSAAPGRGTSCSTALPWEALSDFAAKVRTHFCSAVRAGGPAEQGGEAPPQHSAVLLELVLEASPDPIWIKDLQGRFTLVNSAAAAVLGRSRQALVGLRDRDVLPAAFADKLEAEDLRIMRNGESLRVEETLLDAGRAEQRVYASVKVPLRSAEGHIAGMLGIARDVTEHKATEQALADLNATLESQVRERTQALQQLAAREQAILCCAASAIVTTDLQGRITSFNPAAEALFGLPAAQVLGRPVLQLHDARDLQAQLPQALPADAMPVLRPIAEADVSGIPVGQGSEWLFTHADGRRFPGLLSLSVLRDAGQQPMGLLGVVTDLSERKALEDELRRRTSQAEAASAAKSAFLANMSHELRTPLNAVIGLSQVLQQMALPPQAQAYVGHIADAGAHLLALTNDVLDLSRIEAGQLRIETVAFELRPLLDEVLAALQPQAEAKGLRLSAELAPELPRRLVSDPLRLRQMLLNLLSNAVKFTDTGGVTLRARVLVPGGRQVLLRLDVADTGIGIDSQLLPRLFEPFTQADASVTRRHGGSGLGLSTVQRLVDLMGGTLLVSSQPGQGSTFSLKLPFDVG
ncbi:PAS domain-containing sensor histidine kinase [Azohydromonas australica]|uniref:PAS domain-containing sensor histidine kinase n=1 Tax=Azohydromonas australica TaxID=364039 RepID=UPI000400894B|nr:PAS domain-containing protein [Azohydromonas australica]